MLQIRRLIDHFMVGFNMTLQVFVPIIKLSYTYNITWCFKYLLYYIYYYLTLFTNTEILELEEEQGTGQGKELDSITYSSSFHYNNIFLPDLSSRWRIWHFLGQLRRWKGCWRGRIHEKSIKPSKYKQII